MHIEHVAIWAHDLARLRHFYETYFAGQANAKYINPRKQFESYFLTFAIDPNRNGSYGSKPEVVSPDNIGTVQLDDYDLVVLADVPGFNSSTRSTPRHQTGHSSGVITHPAPVAPTRSASAPIGGTSAGRPAAHASDSV